MVEYHKRQDHLMHAAPRPCQNRDSEGYTETHSGGEVREAWSGLILARSMWPSRPPN